jgi:hypothetical protein
MATFSLSPSAIDDAVLDYTDKADIKKFEKAITKLNNTFHGKSEQMTVFKGDLELHASNNGWSNGLQNSDIISIPTMANANIRYNLIHEYSRLTNEDITAWANAVIVGKQTRKAQNNANMHQCLYNSLSSSMVNKMLLESHRYTIDNTPIAALYYKAIMGHSNVDTLATISLTRHMLSSLDVKMIDLNSNISDFNIYVSELRNKLTQYGATSEDTLVNLFRGYKAARDNSFVDYIKKIERDYQYGNETITVDQLMTKALTAYQVEVERGNWGALSEDQQMIVAMQSELKQLKDSKLQLDTNKGKGKGKDKEKGKGKGKGKSKKSNNQDNSKNDAWKEKAPRNGANLTKTHDGKTYYWYKNHRDGKGKWVLHKLEDCRNKPSTPSTRPVANAASTTDSAPSTPTPTVTPNTTFAAAAAAAAIQALNDSESD